MNAMMHSFDDVETAPMPWALPFMVVGAGERTTSVDTAKVVDQTTRMNLTAVVHASADHYVSGATILMSACITGSFARDACLMGRQLTTRELMENSLWTTQTSHYIPTIDCLCGSEAGAIRRLTQPATLVAALGKAAAQTAAAMQSVSCTSLTNTIVPPFDVGLVASQDQEQGDAHLLSGYEDYSAPNWDGQGAVPISGEALAAARSFLMALPYNLGNPDIAPAADGTIGFEWVPESRGRLKKLFIDVGPTTSWRAYWKMADGGFDRASGNTTDPDLRSRLKDMFNALSS